MYGENRPKNVDKEWFNSIWILLCRSRYPCITNIIYQNIVYKNLNILGAVHEEIIAHEMEWIFKTL